MKGGSQSGRVTEPPVVVNSLGASVKDPPEQVTS